MKKVSLSGFILIGFILIVGFLWAFGREVAYGSPVTATATFPNPAIGTAALDVTREGARETATVPFIEVPTSTIDPYPIATAAPLVTATSDPYPAHPAIFDGCPPWKPLCWATKTPRPIWGDG